MKAREVVKHLEYVVLAAYSDFSEHRLLLP